MAFSSIFATEAGAYSVIELEDSLCAATDTASFTLNVRPLPVVDAGADRFDCFGDTLLLGTVGLGGQIYSWGGSADLLSTTGAQVAYVSTYSLNESTLILSTFKNGCSDSDTVVVETFPKPEAQIIGASELCAGDTLSIVGLGGEGVLWSPPAQFDNPSSAATRYHALADTDIQLTVSSAAGCRDSVVRLVEVHHATPAVFSASVHKGCIPFDVSLTALFSDPATSYQWTLAGVVYPVDSSAIALDIDRIGLHPIRLKTSYEGCTDTYQLDETIRGFDTFADFSFSPPAPSISSPEVFFHNESDLGTRAIWTVDSVAVSDSENLAHSFPEVAAALYEVCVDVTSDQGCHDRHCEPIRVAPDFFVYMPTAFTPDGDGLNDLFGAELTNIGADEYRFFITDRWGELVFETTEIGKKWDGSQNGGGYFCESGVYIWSLELKPTHSLKVERYTGQVVLVR